MADMLTVLQQLLCYGNSACVQEFNQYAYKPMEGIFYAVFFPILTIIIFVYIVSGAVGSFKARGIRLLLAVAFFAFIILQGFYAFFITISKFWFFVLFLLGILWFAIHTFTGRSGGGGAKGRTLGGGLGASISARVMNQAKGKVGRVENDLKRAIERADGLISRVNAGEQGAYRAVDGAIEDVESRLEAYRTVLSVEGVIVGGSTKHLEERVNNVIKRLQDARQHYDKKGGDD